MLNAQLIQHLKDVIAEYDAVASKCSFGDLSDAPSADSGRLIVRGQYAIERIAGTQSIFAKEVVAALRTPYRGGSEMMAVFAVARGLLAELEAGHLKTVEEMAHAEVFGDFLEMADYFVEGDYKDAAAVIAGSVLEGHLRQLCSVRTVDITVTTKDGTAPKKADAINADLVKASAYEKGDQKQVTAWLDLRNNAAHGHYGKYQKEQVRLMITGIRDFIRRVPA